MMKSREESPTIVLGVTVDMSLSFLRDFPQALAAAGWTVHVVASPGAGFDEFRNIDGVHVHAIPMEREPSPLRDIISLFKWTKLLQQTRPNVVSVGTPKASLLGLLAAFLCRVPRRTYHLRGLRLEGETGLKYSLLRAIEKINIAVATDVLAVSPSLRETALRLRLIKPHKIQVIGSGSSNGVDLERFRPAALGAAEHAQLLSSLGLVEGLPVIGFVGRLARDKGIDHLLAASRMLHTRGVQHQLLMVGNVEDPSLAALGPLEKAVGGRIGVTGRVKNTQPYYQIMDVLALPTLREGMPNVALEAQASGVPVVTTNVTGARDSIIDGSTGFLTSYGDVTGMVQALEQIMLNAETRQTMTMAAREFVVKHFDRYKIWDGLMTYYSRRGGRGDRKTRHVKEPTSSLDFT